jgi:hypothetical protein
MLSVSILYDFIDIARRGGIQLASMYIDKMSLFTMLGEPNEVIFAAGLFTTLNPIYVFLIIYLVVALFLIFYMVKQGYGVYS